MGPQVSAGKANGVKKRLRMWGFYSPTNSFRGRATEEGETESSIVEFRVCKKMAPWQLTCVLSRMIQLWQCKLPTKLEAPNRPLSRALASGCLLCLPTPAISSQAERTNLGQGLKWQVLVEKPKGIALTIVILEHQTEESHSSRDLNDDQGSKEKIRQTFLQTQKWLDTVVHVSGRNRSKVSNLTDLV